MARHLIAYGLCVLSVVLAEQLLAQDTLSVDLALATNDTVTIDQGRYRILVVNRVPRYRYSIRVAVHAIPMAALDVSPALTRELQSPCPMLASTIDTLAAARREEEVPTALNGIDSAMAKEGSNSACSKLVERGRGLRDSTRVADPDIYKFSVGQYITVKVSRLADGGATARGWERTFTTGSGGEWRVSYGFIFPIVSGLAKHGGLRDEASYFAKQIDTSHYMISQQRTTRTFDAVPIVAFSFAPAGNSRFRMNPVMAGLGADVTNPMAFLGTGFTYNSNLYFSFGAVARREPELRGIYRVGDTIRTGLTSDQLEEQVFRVRPFVSLTFRFSSSPFKSAGAGEASGRTEAKPEKKNEDKKRGGSPAARDTSGTRGSP